MVQKDNIYDILRSSRLRITNARIRILDLLISSSEALSHQQVEEGLKAKGFHIDTVTIYRTLNSLTEYGVIHKVTGVDRSFLYAFAQLSGKSDHQHSSNHPHFTCQKCTHTFCLPELSESVTIQAPQGFELIHAEITLVGFCPECA
jgi:Fur family transcriptional regulator, ferric uptake regulator